MNKGKVGYLNSAQTDGTTAMGAKLIFIRRPFLPGSKGQWPLAGMGGAHNDNLRPASHSASANSRRRLTPDPIRTRAISTQAAPAMRKACR